jgi:hypothetical protein
VSTQAREVTHLQSGLSRHDGHDRPKGRNRGGRTSANPHFAGRARTRPHERKWFTAPAEGEENAAISRGGGSFSPYEGHLPRLGSASERGVFAPCSPFVPSSAFQTLARLAKGSGLWELTAGTPSLSPSVEKTTCGSDVRGAVGLAVGGGGNQAPGAADATVFALRA